MSSNNIITKNIYSIISDNLCYLESEYNSIMSLLQDTKTKYGGNILEFKSSSGNSLLLIFENFVFKIYNKSHRDKIKKEFDILDKLRDCGCLRILHYMDFPCTIVFEKLKPPVKCDTLNIDEIKTFIFDIATSLNCIHSRNCIHRDVAHTNICYRENESKYVLIDFENSVDFDSSEEKNLNKEECMYNDVKMFLEDLNIQCTSIDIKNYISLLLQNLKTTCETEKEAERIFLGRKRMYKYSEIKYTPDTFLNSINNLKN